MNKKILFLFLVVIFLSCSNKEKTDTTDTTDTTGKGFIEGFVSYPSEGMPGDMKVFAENIETQEIFEIDLNKINNPKKFIANDQSFRFILPPGIYYLFAMTEYPSFIDYKAFYSEFVTSGKRIDSPSHKPIPITVQIGETVTGIDVGDWYNTNF